MTSLFLKSLPRLKGGWFANLKDRIQSLQKQLNGLLGSSSVTSSTPTKAKRKGRRKMTAAEKARQSALMKEYWKKRKAGKK